MRIFIIRNFKYYFVIFRLNVYILVFVYIHKLFVSHFELTTYSPQTVKTGDVTLRFDRDIRSIKQSQAKFSNS